MRKILSIITILICSVTYGQKFTNHTPYVSISGAVGLKSGSPMSVVEAGLWGITSSNTYAAFVVFDGSDRYLGLKYYYTIYDKNKFSSMIYFAPQLKVTGEKTFVMEEGIGLNYSVHKHILFGYYVGISHSKYDAINPAMSLCVVFLR